MEHGCFYAAAGHTVFQALLKLIDAPGDVRRVPHACAMISAHGNGIAYFRSRRGFPIRLAQTQCPFRRKIHVDEDAEGHVMTSGSSRSSMRQAA